MQSSARKCDRDLVAPWYKRADVLRCLCCVDQRVLIFHDEIGGTAATERKDPLHQRAAALGGSDYAVEIASEPAALAASRSVISR